MVKFFAGVIAGGLLMAVIASSHPGETKEVLKSGSDHITSGVSAGATAAANAANKQFGNK
jgi:hypothetical protein